MDSENSVSTLTNLVPYLNVLKQLVSTQGQTDLCTVISPMHLTLFFTPFFITTFHLLVFSKIMWISFIAILPAGRLQFGFMVFCSSRSYTM